ncbi:uncharacterized protein METZ01_LOCUS387726 [marine metagenome]|uniref:Uncharacterized protein n=1 Tax=marine metagenome TaxID=408172 RepID=A0A382UL26_9ZZZZ
MFYADIYSFCTGELANLNRHGIQDKRIFV